MLLLLLLLLHLLLESAKLSHSTASGLVVVHRHGVPEDGSASLAPRRTQYHDLAC